MIFHYGQTGAKRKKFVNAISGILGKPAVYKAAPTFAYAVEIYTVDRDGNLCCPDDADIEKVKHLVDGLAERGLMAADTDEVLAPFLAAENTETGETDRLVIAMPRAGFTGQALENLQKIVDSKTTLLKLALNTDCLDITTDGQKVYFPWFRLHGLEGEADAYSRLVSAICDMARRQKRVIATEKPIENAKFSMRVFLIRLGFIGDEYKSARKILLRNLAGNSSWKHGTPPERAGRHVQRPETASIPPVPAQAEIITDYNRLLMSGLTAEEVMAADTELETIHREKAGVNYGK